MTMTTATTINNNNDQPVMDTNPACADQPAQLAPVPESPADPWDCQPGESPNAFAAFLCYIDHGPPHSFQAVAQHTGQSLDAVYKLSSRHHWRDRAAALQQHLLSVRRAQAATEEARITASSADRVIAFKEREFQSVLQLFGSAQHILGAFAVKDPDKLTLHEASKAIEVASRIGRLAAGIGAAKETGFNQEADPAYQEFTAALKKIYGPNALTHPGTPTSPPMQPCNDATL